MQWWRLGWRNPNVWVVEDYFAVPNTRIEEEEAAISWYDAQAANLRSFAPPFAEPPFTPAQARSLALAVRHVNASTPDTITEAGLWRCIRTGVVPGRHLHHVRAFIDETDLATLTDMVLSGAVTYRQLAALAERFLLQGHDTRLWLRERSSL